MNRSICVLSGILAANCIGITEAAEVPNARLRVAVQQREDGKLDRAVHLLDLMCLDGCFLTSVSLNQCGPGSADEVSFTPVVQRSSTREGNLKVRAEGSTLIVEETGFDIGGNYTNSFRFGYRPISGLASELTSFSGGFVKHSDILKKVITVEYVPLPKRWQVVKLECGVALPGVER